MIRIDLGHDRLEASAKQQGSRTSIDIGNVFAPVAKKLKLDIAGVLTLVVGAGLSALFPLFLEQYKDYTTKDFATKKRKLQVNAEQVNREIGKLTPYQKELESYEQQKKLVSSRLAVVRDLLTSRNTPVAVLDTVGQHLPKKTWVNSLDLSLADVDGSLMLVGSSYSNEEIAEYVDRLSSSVYLKDVALEDVSTRVEEKVEVRGFQITAKTKEGGLGNRVTPAGAPGAPGVPSAGQPAAGALKPPARSTEVSG
ncbi:MAG: PilN domain-containing protein [Deltaproteobacteria bacterium]|nr:PilN domain-containing protein [Deltaproteobacteria bacterium]MBI3293944.1 PilN domain-containing protein [Deltaproteobacteria bacterium]